MTTKTIVIIGTEAIGNSHYISNLIESLGENIIVIDDVADKIIFPKDLTIDDVIHLGSEEISTERLLKMTQDLKTEKEVTGLLDSILSERIVPFPLVSAEMNFFNDNNSKFIPNKSGTERRNSNKKRY